MSPTEPVLRLRESQARQLHLAAQGLLNAPPARPTRAALLAAIARMQLLQIDTIHVVARSPYLVLFSRVGAYPMAWLDELLERGAIFEVWAHEACFAPAADFALHDAARALRAGHWAHRHARRMHAEQRDGMDRLLSHVREHGAVRAADFERSQPGGGGWWGWKDEKRWLEAWFALGELMVARRERFQRVYDLRERVVARFDSAPAPDDLDRALLLRAVDALGIAQARWIADYFRTARRHRDGELDELVEARLLLRVAVDGWDVPAYVHPRHLDLARRAATGRLRATRTTLLSPFDPIVWDRKRASALFGFDYTIECYTPAPKRRYGYFVLPILRRGALVGRLDAKAHRDAGEFEVKAIHLENGIRPDAALVADVADAIRACAEWHGTPRVRVVRGDSMAFVRALRAALREAG